VVRPLKASGAGGLTASPTNAFRDRIGALKLSILRQVPRSGVDALYTGVVES
jgi:hypothetical protein